VIDAIHQPAELAVEITCYSIPRLMLASIKPEDGHPPSTSNLGQAASGFPAAAAKTFCAAALGLIERKIRFGQSDGEPSETLLTVMDALEAASGATALRPSYGWPSHARP
jgi:hypothetical protein